jgi:hypothetical protein
MTWAVEYERRCDACERGEPDPWMVGRTWFADGSFVSTVFLGLDHSFMPDPPAPEIFETALFIKETGIEDIFRCATWDQSLVIHRLMVNGSVERFGQPVKSILLGVVDPMTR